jgi:hypothetical protein
VADLGEEILVAVDEVIRALVAYLDARGPETFAAMVMAGRRLKTARENSALRETPQKVA